ncbi:MAG TPA: proline--tRNA ligase, partial [Kosmotoga arenicorallina]|nr:proline--tRNA ligase [Kosmotoga arenicorallina]
DPCPKCGKPLMSTKGIELGHIFKLGTKYSEKMNGYFTDENGDNKPYIMGCYGWGVSRTLSASVEQLHDKNGIIWPLSIAPFQIVISALNTSDEQIMKVSEDLYAILQERGYEVLLDDRNISPGVKFKDADLIGIPLRITVGRKLKEQKLELKLRTSPAQDVEIDEKYTEVLEKIAQLLDEYAQGDFLEVR